jgi:hypothetical protein
MRTDGRTDMKLIVTSRSFANAPKNLNVNSSTNCLKFVVSDELL